MHNIEEITAQADYFARMTNKIILNYLEAQNKLDFDTRKVVLDAINTFKRNLVQYIVDNNG